MIGKALHIPGNLPMMPLYMMGAVIGMIMRRLRNRTAHLRATDAGIMLDGKLAVARGKVKQALVWHEKEDTWVRFSSSALLDVKVRDDAEARHLLRVLRLDARSTTTTFQLTRDARMNARVVALVLGTLVAIAGSVLFLHGLTILPVLGVILVALLGGLIAAGRAGTATIVVGADGLRIRDGWKKNEFISHAMIKHVESVENTIVIGTTDGKSRQYTAAQRGRSKADKELAARQAEAIAGRIRDARDAYVSEGGDVAPALERGGKTAREWLELLKRVGAGAEAAFREAQIPRDRLWRIAESTSAPLAQRVAATIALRTSGEKKDDPRLRVLVEQCAKEEDRERLRVAVETEDEEELAASLDRMGA